MKKLLSATAFTLATLPSFAQSNQVVKDTTHKKIPQTEQHKDGQNLFPGASPLFSAAKINGFGDQFLPGGQESEGSNNFLSWSYTTGPLPDVDIHPTPGSRNGNQATYLGYDQQGSYLLDAADGKYKRWDGEKLVTVEKVPEKLYNDAEAVRKANYESTHGKGSYERDAGKSSPPYTPPANDAVVVPTTAEYSGDDDTGSIKIIGGKDTVEHKVIRPTMYKGQFDKGTGPYVEKTKEGKFIMYTLNGQGEYDKTELTDKNLIKGLGLGQTVQK